MATISSTSDLAADDFHLADILLSGDEDDDSDAKYAEELQFQEALMASYYDHNSNDEEKTPSSSSNPAPIKSAEEIGESAAYHDQNSNDKEKTLASSSNSAPIKSPEEMGESAAYPDKNSNDGASSSNAEPVNPKEEIGCASTANDVQNSNNKEKSSASSSSNSESVKSVEEIRESSHIYCEICMENKEIGDMINVQSCNQSFCLDCVRQYVEVKISDKVSVIACPGFKCESVLEQDTWRPIISKHVVDHYDEILCELSILDSQKFYCPFKDCSAVLLNDHGTGDDDEVMMIRESECPECRRMFCAVCCVPWHSGIGCEEFQSLNEDERGSEDVKVMILAKENKWNRCRFCSMYVEKNEGCHHITCRCGSEWCYLCGEEWSQTHGDCQRPGP